MITLAVIVTGILLASFATGYRMGRGSGPHSLANTEKEHRSLDENSEASDSTDHREENPAERPGIPLAKFLEEEQNAETDKPDPKQEVAANHSMEEKKTNPRAAIIKEEQQVKLSNVGHEPSEEKEKPLDEVPYYTFQMGAFQTEAKANDLVAKLKKDGFHPYLKQTSGKVNVRVGRSTSRRDLWSLEHELKKHNYSFFLVTQK